MHNTYLIKDSCVYTRLQGIIWHASGLTNPTFLNFSAVEILNIIYKEINDDRPLVINCKNVDRIVEHSLDLFFDVVFNSPKRKVVFINYEKIKEEIVGHLYQTHRDYFVYSDSSILSIGKEYSNEFDKLIEKADNYELEFIHNIICTSFSFFDSTHEKFQQLYSTNFLINGEFDATNIISNPKNFLWISLRLADVFLKIKSDLEKENASSKFFKQSDIKILAVSLRGAPFASSISLLTNTPLSLIDHLGPNHYVLNYEFSEYSKRYTSYIYVGDFVFGGTEIKMAQTYIRMINSELKYAISVGSLLDENLFTKKFELKSLYSNLSEKIHGLKYKI